MTRYPVANQKTFDKSLKIGLSLISSEVYYLYKKIERVVSAVHIITSLFDEVEPLRLYLRKVSISVLDMSADLFTDKDTERVVEALGIELAKCLSLLEVAHRSGVLTKMNYEIMESEIAFVLKRISYLTASRNLRDEPDILLKNSLAMEDVTDTLIRKYKSAAPISSESTAGR